MLIDAHHHLWDAGHLPRDTYYMDAEYLADIAGLGIEATVFVECMTHYDPSLAPPLRPVGETRFAAAVAERWSSSPTRLCAAIVALADPIADMPFDMILDAHVAVAKGRLRGIRRSAAWDQDPALVYQSLATSESMLADPGFAYALRLLADRGLLFETWVYHKQIGEVAALARAVPACTVVLDHAGTPMMRSGHDSRERTSAEWREGMARAADVPNLVVKIGGFATPGTVVDAIRSGRGVDRWTVPALAEALAPFLDHMIGCFGAERCLFESNFPVDRATCDYQTLWRAYDLALHGRSEAERRLIFGGNAARLYGIA